MFNKTLEKEGYIVRPLTSAKGVLKAFKGHGDRPDALIIATGIPADDDVTDDKQTGKSLAKQTGTNVGGRLYRNLRRDDKDASNHTPVIMIAKTSLEMQEFHVNDVNLNVRRADVISSEEIVKQLNVMLKHK